MKIAIAGYGIEGASSFKYWDKPGNQVVIADERTTLESIPAGVETILGSDALTQLAEFDLIVRSPSVNPKKLAYSHNVWSATNEFFAKCPAPIIGVTGTKGKGTTSSLIASILKAAGRNVYLVGNIGVPALSELERITPEDIVVFELSSFQLWDIQASPHIAVLLPIEPDHLDVHDSLEDYISAKMNIVRYQTENDFCVSHISNQSLEGLAGIKSEHWEYPSIDGVHVIDGWFYGRFEKIAPVDSLQLPGDHNVENACAAIMAATHASPNELAGNEQAISDGLRAFEGLPHRLKFVKEKSGVKYYDDSIATTPGSAIAAIKSFNQPKILILGGSDKGADYSELIELCKKTDTRVLAIGRVGEQIAKLCAQHGVTCEYVEGTMDQIVVRANELAQPGDVVILSPAAASFDMFNGYADRGEKFITAVNSL